MLRNFISVLKNQIQADKAEDKMEVRRNYLRRRTDRCVSVIAGKMYPVLDWSMGGMKITGDGRLFRTHDEVDFTIKFKLREDIIDVPHKARVVRRTQDSVAFEFLPLNMNIRKSFQQVVDDYVSRRFAESQMV